jgi:hypothetical protein
MVTEIKVRVDPGGRALLGLGRFGYRLRTLTVPAWRERVPAVLGTASLILFGLGWIPLIRLQATGGEPTGLHLAPVGIGLAGLLFTGLVFAWREIAGELLGYLAIFLLVTLFPLYFPLLVFPAVGGGGGGRPPPAGGGGGGRAGGGPAATRAAGRTRTRAWPGPGSPTRAIAPPWSWSTATGAH